ncbi:MAG: ABC transporter ATP-binding protein [Epsilonproteobacteria bacterium]|nr:ABC transporter ATP-binding protein [Campylobacterota bacterium]
MKNKILEIKGITKVYKIYRNNYDRLKEIFFKKVYHKEFIANDNITFDLYDTETLGIIGVNGAGKSTLLKIISGVIDPTAGEVIKHGRVTALLELGTGFNFDMSGYDNIFLNGTLIGMTKQEIEEKIDKIIEFSELGDYIHEPVKSYSSGMSMRLAFSIALFSEPQILIVDEALSVGDAHFQAKCTNALKERKEKNMSIIYVSHDLNSLKILCDRLILLDKGKIYQEGDPEDVINTYNYLISTLDKSEQKIKIIKNKKSSYGSLDVEIKSVSIKSKQEATKKEVFISGEDIRVSLVIDSKKDLPNMTVGFLIRDKYGQDIFGTNTFHHKKNIDFKKNKKYLVNFDFALNLGVGKYTITAAVHSQDTHIKNCSHWVDFATEFEVVLDKNTFIGLVKLDPKISWEYYNNEA